MKYKPTMIHATKPSYAYINIDLIIGIRKTKNGYWFLDKIGWWETDEETYIHLLKRGIQVYE